MPGIIDFGSYLPYYRLKRRDIGAAWALTQAMPLLLGERTVASFDEDSATMAVEAVLNCLAGRDNNPIDGLFFASTSPPLAEKSSAALIAAACDLTGVTRSADFGHSLRAGTTALQAALDAVKAGSAQNIVVVAADMRQAAPGTIHEAVFGDGAAAILVGQGEAVLLDLVAQYHLSAPVIDAWRPAHARYLRTDDEAYTTAKGYNALTTQALDGLLAKASANTPPAQIDHVIASAPDGRSYMNLARKSPLAPAFNQEPLLMQAGNLGTASVLAQLASVLESGQVKPGQTIALVGYGDGADAFLFRATEALARRAPRRRVMDWLARKAYLPSYNLALFFREGVKGKEPYPVDLEPWTSLPLQHREQISLLNFHGVQCEACGAVWWPIRSHCYECGGQAMRDIKLSRRGKVASYTTEWATPSPLPPTGMVVVDNEAGGRLTTPLCDGAPDSLKIGAEVEFTLRILHQAKGLPHYTWKVRQVMKT